MTYSLKFHPDALKEWQALPAADKRFFKQKLAQRLEQPHVPASRLSGGSNLYKIKRKRPPLRLTYLVRNHEMLVIALSVGKRDSAVYAEMIRRYRPESTKKKRKKG